MKVQHVLAALPFAGVLGGMFFANSVQPYVLGLPFAMFWVVMWVVLAAGLMAVVYRLDARERDAGRSGEGEAERVRVPARGDHR